MTAAEPQRASRFLDRDFRWRGTDVSRMEALADAVFALVLALLFLQTVPPANVRELEAALKGLVPFTITFTLLAMVWVDHHRYFRRYGLTDKTTFFGNLILLGLVLFYAYPLKFLFTFLCVGMFGPIGELDSQSMAAGMDQLGNTNLMLVYSTGFGANYVTYALLFRHALSRAGELGLDEVDRQMTVTSIVQCLVLVGFAAASVALSLIGHVAFSGFVYFGIGPVMAVVGFRRGAAQERLVKARGAPSA
jgi:hypothetical protein